VIRPLKQLLFKSEIRGIFVERDLTNIVKNNFSFLATITRINPSVHDDRSEFSAKSDRIKRVYNDDKPGQKKARFLNFASEGPDVTNYSLLPMVQSKIEGQQKSSEMPNSSVFTTAT
jgi:hypothetical protein